MKAKRKSHPIKKSVRRESILSSLFLYGKKNSRKINPSFLIGVASAVRTGLDPITAVRSVASFLPKTSLLRQEIQIFNRSLDAGMGEEEAIISLGQRINHPDIKLFVTTLLLARAEGSSLGVCLQRLNQFTRQRQAFRREAKTAVAMQKLSSFGICGCGLVIGLMQLVMNGESMKQAFHHPLGFLLLSSGSGMLAIGLIWMLYLGRSRL